MEQQILDEILKDTFTLGDLKKRFLGLKLELQKKIYQGESSVDSHQSSEEKKDEIEKSVDSEIASEKAPRNDVIAISRSEEAIPESKATISEETAKWVSSFSPEMKEKINDKNYSEVCALIEGVIDKGTTLTIFFVFIPDNSQVEGFGKWLREHLKNPELLFDVKIDSSLIGGCAISYKGVYRDYSLKARIAANKANLMEEFRGYLRK